MSSPLDSFGCGSFADADGNTRFRVWAPRPKKIALRILDGSRPEIPLREVGDGYHETAVRGVGPGSRYFFRLDDQRDRPDPASRFQPLGVHGPSQVTSREFSWTDRAWRGRPWGEFVIYEAHVGTFTAAGTFEAMIDHLDGLVDLGITALELMPIAQFPGERNWGYDGVHPFAPQSSYGGPVGLKRLVDACHARGLAVVLDVVYNHLGPEGNYLGEFGPYFSDRYKTPWGPAINFDGPDSDAVRDYFVGNALYWLEEFHIDALRLDATHAIFDQSPRHFLRELAESVAAWRAQSGRQAFLIAEHHADDPRVVGAIDSGGFGLDAQHLDDFERSLHTLLTPERGGFYVDYGRLDQFATAYRSGFVFTGERSHYRRRRWGTTRKEIAADKFLVYSQTHDSVGNRPGGERLGRLVDFEALKLAAAATILSPSIPMLFMGEEYDELAPFYYFTSHADAGLIDSVRKGREQLCRQLEPDCTLADPQAADTFERSKLTRQSGLAADGHALREFYRELLRLRQHIDAIRHSARDRQSVEALTARRVIIDRRKGSDGGEICLCMYFGDHPIALAEGLPSAGVWRVVLDSADQRWNGPNLDVATSWTPGKPLNLGPTSCILLHQK